MESLSLVVKDNSSLRHKFQLLEYTVYLAKIRKYGFSLHFCIVQIYLFIYLVLLAAARVCLFIRTAFTFHSILTFVMGRVRRIAFNVSVFNVPYISSRPARVVVSIPYKQIIK